MSDVNKQLLEAVKEFFDAEQSEGREKFGHFYKPATREHQQRERIARAKLHEAIAAAEQAQAETSNARAVLDPVRAEYLKSFMRLEHQAGESLPAQQQAEPVALTNEQIEELWWGELDNRSLGCIRNIIAAAQPPAVADVARVIWNIRREEEDRCDMELEDMGTDHSVWRDAEAVCFMLAAAPQAVATGWIDPNDKTQKQYLPHIGEPVLFCHDGVTYYGQHTGGSFETVNGFSVKYFETCD